MSKRDLGTRPLLAGTALVACLGLGLSQAQAAAAGHASRLGTAGAELDQLHSLTIENHALELQQRQLTNQLDWQVSQGRSGAGVEAVADRLQALSKADGALLEQEAGLARRIDGQLAGHVAPHLDTKLATITTEIGQNHAAVVGAKEPLMDEIAEMIETVLSNVENAEVIQSVRERVNKTMAQYPLFA